MIRVASYTLILCSFEFRWSSCSHSVFSTHNSVGNYYLFLCISNSPMFYRKIGPKFYSLQYRNVSLRSQKWFSKIQIIFLFTLKRRPKKIEYIYGIYEKSEQFLLPSFMTFAVKLKVTHQNCDKKNQGNGEWRHVDTERTMRWNKMFSTYRHTIVG